MRYSPDHKRQTHARILETAARLFCGEGFTATGVDTVMASAGMTAGGFYSHFRSKQALLAEALDLAFQQSSEHARSGLEELKGTEWARGFLALYLSKGHRDAAERGCPMPALASEVSRLKSGSREVFEQHLRRRFAEVESKLDLPSGDGGRAIPAVALCVGALLLARAVRDPTLSDRILEECRAAVLRDISGTDSANRRRQA